MPKINAGINNAMRERILEAAERLFSERGFAAVTLRDIAKVVDIHHASLYYYVPKGKAQLFVEVMERKFMHHRNGMMQAIDTAGNDVRAQLRAVAHWLIAQPPLDLNRMSHADIRAVDSAEAVRLMELAHGLLHQPLIAALERARQAGQVNLKHVEMAALSFVSLMEGLQAVPAEYQTLSSDQAIEEVLNMLLDGWLPR